jgi:hypothetical protein
VTLRRPCRVSQGAIFVAQERHRRVASPIVVAAGLPARLTAELRCARGQVERSTSTAQALQLLRRTPGRRVLLVSEQFPGAGDLLAAVEADYVLAIRTLVAIVGGETALAVALRSRGVPVVGRRGAAKRLNRLLQSPHAAPCAASQRLQQATHARAVASERQVRESQRLIEQSLRLVRMTPRDAHSVERR